MPRKPNYRAERAERDRAKQAKRQEKLKKQQERGVAQGDDEASDANAQPEPSAGC